MSLVDDSHLMEKELLERYKKVAKSRWAKILIHTKLYITSLWFYVECWWIAVRSIYYYYHTTSPTHLYKDIRYSSIRPRCVMDVYIPTTSAPILGEIGSITRPCLVFVHGGSWGFGDKLQYILLGKKLAERGVITVVANYTLHPVGLIDEMVQDVELLLQYVKNNVREYGGSPDNIHLMGHSAGAHISALYVASRLISSSSSTSSSSPPSIRSFIGIGGVYDISDHFIHESKRGVEDISPMRPTCKGPSKFKLYSPTDLISIHEEKSLTLPCNMFLLHGEIDTTVPVSSSEKFDQIISSRFKSNNTKKDGPFRYLFNRYANQGHIDLLFSIYLDDTEIEVDRADNYKKPDKQSLLCDIIRLIDRRT